MHLHICLYIFNIFLLKFIWFSCWQ